MGIFSGANGNKPASGSKNSEDRPFFTDGQRRVRIERSLLRISSNEGSKNYGQAMVITEFTVLENITGEEMGSGKTIEILAKAPNGAWLPRGKYALGRVQSMVASACGFDEVGEEVLGSLYPTDELEAGKAKFSEAEALQGIEVIAVTSTFSGDKGSLTTTRFEPVG
jgi:hypothetical protein